jgi:hypothetical protein
MKTKTKSKTSKTNRKADESPSKPQSKKKGKASPKKQSAKAKDHPEDEPARPTDSASTQSLVTAAAEPGTTVTETSVAAVDAGTGESASAAPPAGEGPSTTAPNAAMNESRMPAIGTVLQKRDRKGTLRCECEVVEGGVRYGGTVYRSLSSAAVAAAKDLGLAAKAMNGFTFWGVSKPARPTADPLGGLERAWNKYQARLEAVLERAKAGDHKEPALTTLERHTRVLQNLLQEVG